MDTTEIQRRLDKMPAAMSAKGLRAPGAELTVRANQQPQVYLYWEKPGKGRYEGENYKFISGDSPADALDKADDLIASLPSPEETKLNEFMGALGNVIDLGRQNGIEVEFLNPLVATMKKLSENALTDQRAA